MRNTFITVFNHQQTVTQDIHLSMVRQRKIAGEILQLPNRFMYIQRKHKRLPKNNDGFTCVN